MANIGYPDTKNKKVSSTPLFNKKKDKEEMVNTILERNDSLSKNDAQTIANRRARMAESARTGVKQAEWLAKKPGKKNASTTTKKKDESKGGLNKQGVWVKKGGKATGKIKDYAHGSKARYDEYEARGWTHDDTTKGYKPETKTIATDSKDVTSENVPVKSNRQRKKETRATKRVTKLQKKAVKKGSLTNAQKKKLARNEQKSRGEKVSDENRTKAGKLISKVGSKIKTKIAEIKKKKEEKKKKKENPITYTKLKGKNKSKNLKIL